MMSSEPHKVEEEDIERGVGGGLRGEVKREEQEGREEGSLPSLLEQKQGDGKLPAVVQQSIKSSRRWWRGGRVIQSLNRWPCTCPSFKTSRQVRNV